MHIYKLSRNEIVNKDLSSKSQSFFFKYLIFVAIIDIFVATKMRLDGRRIMNNVITTF